MSSTLHQQIIDWLQGPQKWKEGLAIFRSFTSQKSLLSRFDRSGNIQFNRSLLREQLIQKAQYLEKNNKRKVSTPIVKKTTTKPSPAKVEVPKPINPNTVDHAMKPKAIQEIELQKHELYVNMHRQFHIDLPKAKTDIERAAIAGSIIELRDQNQACWDKLRYFKEHGKLPEEPKPEPVKPKKELTPVQMQRTITNRRSNISRYKRLISEDPQLKTIEQKKAKIAEWEEEVKYLSEQLNKIN